MGGQAQASGPDLSQGVALSELKDGEPLSGRVGDDAVLLVRRGDTVHAVGASCTHYGGPLAEGLVAGDTIRCPWHHACFDLRDGSPRSPALNPIPCWSVIQEDGRVRVGEKLAPPAPERRIDKPSSVVIVGAGPAGNAAAETLRREGYTGRLTIVGAESPVDRPNLSKDYLAGNAPEEWLPLRPADFYPQRGIEAAFGATVDRIDVEGRTVLLSDGRSRPWEALILATGADPIRLAVPGADLPHVHTLRTLGDSRAIIAHSQVTQAVIVGASFIGLEAAASLRARGIEVHVVAPESRPLERVFGPDVGELVRTVHEARGVVFHLEQTVTAIDETWVTLSGGTRIEAGLVVVGIGVRPQTALAQATGLTIDRGVVVDDRLATSAPGIWAAGDAARFPDARSGRMVRIEHWAVAGRMGECAARNVLGMDRRFDAVPFFWSAHHDVTLSYVGHAEAWDRIDVHGSIVDRDCTVAYREGGKTLAVLTIGRDRASLAAEAAFEANDEDALARFGIDR
jgi:NADPH-dependent 2,4-dienoyl-CoA reductase/sulfur reductase-like enzyme/nitrite reductase/ring-hydroxylating ferredoxin subunit